MLCDITLAPLAAVADGLTAPQPLIYPPRVQIFAPG